MSLNIRQVDFEHHINITNLLENKDYDSGVYADGSTIGFNGFLRKLRDAYPDLEKHIKTVVKYIKETKCKNIEFKNLNMGLGFASKNHVLLSPNLLNGTLAQTFYIIFYQIGHQYLYVHHAKRRMEGLLKGKGDETAAADFVRKLEAEADRYAIRKCKELCKEGLIKKENMVKYNRVEKFTTTNFRAILNQFRAVCRQKDVRKFEIPAEMFYNYVISGSI